MIAKRTRFPVLALALLAAAFCLAAPTPGHAQFSDDYGEEDFFGTDDPFAESDEDVFGVQEDDFTEGGEFIDESEIDSGAGITAGTRQAQLRVLGEREKLPMNAAWGAGTGLMIGGWFALINNGTNRESQRSLGLGIVIGTVIGVLVGVRTLIQPAAPIPVGSTTPAVDHDSFSLLATAANAAGLGSAPATLTFSLRF